MSSSTMARLAALGEKLEDVIGSDPENLQFWYEQLNEVVFK